MADNTPRLQDALDVFDEGIYIVNEDYTVEYMNKFMRTYFGEGVGKKCYEVLTGEDQPCEWCRHEKVFKKQEAHRSEVYVPAVGKTFDVNELPVTNRDGTRAKLSIYRDISDVVAQKAKLKSSLASYQRLFRHVGCGVFISSKEGRFLDVNPALLKILGYEDKDEFLSLDLATDVYLRPEDRLRYQRTIEKKGQVVGYEVRWRRRDGHILHILLTSNVRYGEGGEVLGYEGIVVDQTRRKLSENQLWEAHNFLDNIISCSPNAIMTMEMDGVITLWNEAAEKMFGYAAEEVAGLMNIRDILGSETTGNVLEMMRDAGYGGKGRLNSFSLTMELAGGARLEGNLSAGMIYDGKGRELAWVGLFVDLKERLRTERELSEARQHLLQSEKLAAMGRLTSQIAHELNNPLFGIMNTLELMKTEIPPSNKRRKLLDMSLSETMRLAEMLKKMLSFSKPDQEIRSELDIHMVLDELLLLYEKRFRENSVKLRLNLTEAPARIMGSKDQLRQVFINLFSNAMYAMPDGGELKITTAANATALKITVEDTGTGINSKHIGKIFDSFFTTKTDSVKGVGLGLSVCYGFIKDHGGDIQVASREGEWTRFDISLPLI
ncbi:MAG: PAS domain S-box protein [Desulfobacter sp.]|nr:MAG: PAS domain S-box protein [Desulfobacter sp.]